MAERRHESRGGHWRGATGIAPWHGEQLLLQNETLRETQEALEQAHERYADLYDFAPVGYLTLDRSGQVLEANLTAVGMLGLPREHLVGQPLAPHVAGGTGALFRHLRRVLDDGRRSAVELRLRRKDHSEFDALLESVPERSGADAPSRCRTVLTDVSERKRAEADLAHSRVALEERARQLQQANEELRQFSHVLSHDLKAPLRAMSNLVVLLSEDFGEGLDPGARGYLDMLRARARQADNLIERVLTFFKADNPEAGAERVDSAALVREVATELGSDGEAFRIVIGGGMPVLVTERLPLRQTFANLIGNAVFHHDRDHGEIRIGVREQDGYWEFSVADDGPGIALERQGRIFDMFRTFGWDNGGCSGMGLGLVRKLVAHRGGRILVESAPPRRGSTFRFTWPK